MCMLPDFIEFHVRDQAEPECMQKVECKALLAVEESEAEEIPPQEVSRGPNEGWKTPPRFLEPLRTLIRVPRDGRLHQRTPMPSFSLQLLARHELGVN